MVPILRFVFGLGNQRVEQQERFSTNRHLQKRTTLFSRPISSSLQEHASKFPQCPRCVRRAAASFNREMRPGPPAFIASGAAGPRPSTTERAPGTPLPHAQKPRCAPSRGQKSQGASKKVRFLCHSDPPVAGEESSRTFASPKTPRRSQWILRCASANDRPTSTPPEIQTC